MKPISIQAHEQTIRETFGQMLDTALHSKTYSSKLNLAMDLEKMIQYPYTGAVLAFSMEAYNKLITLIASQGEEAAIHGTVSRKDSREGKAYYFIDDMLVYPQEVSATTVVATDEYTTWIQRLPDDQFNRLRFQAHSHVRMGVTPSGTDTHFYDQILQSVEDFYIFLIMNKNLEIWVQIYDIENNTLYEKTDIAVEVWFDADGTRTNRTFAEEINAHVAKRPVYTPPTPPPAAQNYPNYTGNTAAPKDPEKKTGEEQGANNKIKNYQRHRLQRDLTQGEMDIYMMVIAYGEGSLTQSELKDFDQMIQKYGLQRGVDF